MFEDIDDSLQFYWAVAERAKQLGYTPSQVAIFEADIVDCFIHDKTIEQTLEELF